MLKIEDCTAVHMYECFIVTDGNRLVAAFDSEEDAELFVRAKESVAAHAAQAKDSTDEGPVDSVTLMGSLNGCVEFVDHRYRAPLDDVKPDVILE